MQVRSVAAALLILLVAAPVPARDQMSLTMPGDSLRAEAGALPPAAGPSRAKQFAVAAGGGLLLASAAAVMAYNLVEDDHYFEGNGGDGNLDGVAAGAIAIAIAYPVGSALSLKLFGGGHGSFWGALGVAVAGSLPGLVLAPPTAGASFVIAVPLGAVIGWNEPALPSDSAGQRTR